jgi:hypothetical protein
MAEKFSWWDRIVKGVGVLGFLLACFSLVWQIYTHRESEKENPMVNGSLTQELGPKLEFNKDKRGTLGIEITNLGPRTMEIKNVTLAAGANTWILWSPRVQLPTLMLEPGNGFYKELDWDYANYPIFKKDTSQPTDFLVEIETTRGVHRQHVFIRQITVTSTLK